MFEAGEYPKGGRLAKYEEEFRQLIKVNDNDGIINLTKRILNDCIGYLVTSLNLKPPEVELNLLDQKSYGALCDEIERRFGKRPQSDAIIVGSRLDGKPQICVDFEKHFGYFQSTRKLADFLINLVASYMEELVHSAFPEKSETEVQDDVFKAIEGFAELKLPQTAKGARLENAKESDEIDTRRKNPIS